MTAPVPPLGLARLIIDVMVKVLNREQIREVYGAPVAWETAHDTARRAGWRPVQSSRSKVVIDEGEKW